MVVRGRGFGERVGGTARKRLDWGGLGDHSAEVGEGPRSSMVPGAGGLGGTELGEGNSDWCVVRGTCPCQPGSQSGAVCQCAEVGVGAGSKPLEVLPGTGCGPWWPAVWGDQAAQSRAPMGPLARDGGTCCSGLYGQTVSRHPVPGWVGGKGSQGARMGLLGGLRKRAQGTGGSVGCSTQARRQP